MPFLLDTNVLSELRRGARTDPRVRAWAVSAQNDRHFVSVLSLGEIRKGIELLRRKSPAECGAFEAWLERICVDHHATILPVDERVCDRWGRIQAARTLPVIDGLLAASALEFDLTLVTRNTRDFQGTGVRLLNPFAAS